jgi:radical SAM-linked protein
MRTLHRAFRRADILLAFSQGFNPHPSISVASPLSLGIESIAEYADVEIDALISDIEIKDKLNNALPEGIRILDVIFIKEKMPTSMSAVEAAAYEVSLSHRFDEKGIQMAVRHILDSSEIEVMKKTKSGEKLTDIRPLIKDIKIVECNNDTVKFQCLLLSGSRGNLNPEMVSDLLCEKSAGGIFGYPKIKRTELFTLTGDNWTELASFFSGK